MILIAFIAILLVTFSVMALVTRPSPAQKAIEQRVADLRSARADGGMEMNASLILKSEPVSQFGWLESFLQKHQVARAIELRISQADSKTTVAKLFLTSLGCAVGGFALCSFFLSVLLIKGIVAAILAYIPFAVVSWKRNKRISAFNRALPDAIDMMGRALRAGHSMVAAINIVAEQSVEPVATEFSEVFKQQNFGVPLRDALGQMLDHVPSQDLRVLVTGILVQKETGGNLAEILDRTVGVIRERLRIHGEIKTHTAQGRMTGWILCLLPVAMLFIINMINPGYSNVLINTPFGRKLMYIGLTLLCVGGLIIRQIINGIEV